MFGNRESTSMLPIKKSGCWSTTSSAKWKESFEVNSLAAKSFKIGSKISHKVLGRSFQSKIGQNGGQLSKVPLCNLINRT